jgi:hypothetical protein
MLNRVKSCVRIGQTYVERGGNHPEKENEANADVELSPPGSGERRHDVSDLSPIESDKSHSEALEDAEHLVDLDIVGGDPADPREVGEGGEDVAGEEVPGGRSGKRVNEETLTAHTLTITGTGVLLGVEGIEEGAVHEIGGPNHGRGRNKEAASNTTDRETDQLGGHDNHPLV